MTWSRKGEFNQPIKDESNPLLRRVIYTNTKEHCVIQQLEIFSMFNSAKVGFSLTFASVQELDLFLAKLPRFEGPPTNVSHQKLRATIENEKRVVWKEFLTIVHQNDKFDGKTIKELSAALKIDLPKELDEIQMHVSTLAAIMNSALNMIKPWHFI
jgi:hypothetical protein